LEAGGKNNSKRNSAFFDSVSYDSLCDLRGRNERSADLRARPKVQQRKGAA
jgi:hypothetical protein